MVVKALNAEEKGKFPVEYPIRSKSTYNKVIRCIYLFLILLLSNVFTEIIMDTHSCHTYLE